MSRDPFERQRAEVESLAGVLEPQARRMFAFLRSESGFTQRPSMRRQPMLWTQFIYRAAELGVEIELSWWQRFVSVWLIRLEQGSYPKSGGLFSRPEGGTLIRVRLEQALRDEMGLADDALEELERLRRDSERTERDEAFLGHMLDLYEGLLRRHAAALLLEPLDRLFPSGVVNHHMYQYEVRRELERQVRERFAFLHDEYGFAADPVVDAWTWATSLFFRGRTMGVEVNFEFRDCEIEVVLVKLTDGRPPEPSVLQWDQGVRVRARLERIIEVYLGISDPLTGEIRRAFTNTDWGERNLAFAIAVLERYERLLRAHLGAIARSPQDVIFPHEQPTWGVNGLDWR